MDPIELQKSSEIPKLPDFLLNPKEDEPVSHLLLDLNDENPTARPKKSSENMPDLVKFCLNDTLPPHFPKFLCGLAYIYRRPQIRPLSDVEILFSHKQQAVIFLNNRSNYPCASNNKTQLGDVVGILPDRIFSGCSARGEKFASSRMTSSFVMSHPFPPVQKCTDDQKSECELRTIFMQHYILFQERECCCKTDNCVTLIYAQRETLTPILISTVDLPMEEIVEF